MRGARECWRGADLMVVVESRAEVEEFEPDLGEILSLPDRALLLTGPDSEDDFVLRFFCLLSVSTRIRPLARRSAWRRPTGRSAGQGRRALGAAVRVPWLPGRDGLWDRVLISGEAVTVLKADVTTG